VWSSPPRPALRSRDLALVLTLSLLASVATGCGGDESTRTSALFDLRTGAQQDLFALPWPNDLRRKTDGTLDLARLGEGQIGLIKEWLDAATRGGFSRNSAAYFRFSRAIDPACLPATPAASLLPGASVFWVNIERSSARYTQRVPVRVRFSTDKGLYIDENSLAVLPVNGFTLEPQTRYAVIVTEGLCDTHGDAVQAEANFLKLISASAPGAADADLAAPWATYQVLRDYLADVSLTGVVSAAVFTTGDLTALLARARQVIHRLPAPTATELTAAVDSTQYIELRGSYEAPNFQQGTVPYMTQGGGITLDASGDPVAAKTEKLRFAITIPKEPMPAAGYPLVLYAHGTGGDYRSFISGGTADRVARVTDDDGHTIAAMAMASIDQNLHGPRGTGLPDLTFYNVQNPTAFVANSMQSGIDDFALLRMLKELRVSSVPWSSSSKRTGDLTFDPPLRFDTDRLFFMGHSQGSFTGVLFLAYEPEIKGAVLSGAGGGAILELLERTEPINTRLVLELALREAPDEFHPVMNLLQQAAEGSEALNYGQMLIRRRASGVSAKHIYMSQGFVDHYVPNVTTDALATSIGVPLLGPIIRKVDGLELEGLDAHPLPVRGNLDVDGKAITGGLLQYRAVAQGKTCNVSTDCDGGYCDAGQCYNDGHFVTYRESSAIRHFTRFLATMSREVTPTIGP
jgi:hypothetical protein